MENPYSLAVHALGVAACCRLCASHVQASQSPATSHLRLPRCIHSLIHWLGEEEREKSRARQQKEKGTAGSRLELRPAHARLYGLPRRVERA